MTSQSKTKAQLFFIIALLLISSAAISQERKADLIVKRDSVKVLCKILVVNDQTVQYKKANDPDGPLFNILKSDIARIVYGNGETEVFKAVNSQFFAENQQSVIMYPVAPWRSPGFLDNLSVWRADELRSASDYYKAYAKKSKVVTHVFVAVGSAAAIAGVLVLATSDRSNSYFSSSSEEPGVALMITGLAVGGIAGLASHLKTRKFQKNAARVEEEISRRKFAFQQLKIRPSVNLFNKSASLSLALHF